MEGLILISMMKLNSIDCVVNIEKLHGYLVIDHCNGLKDTHVFGVI